MKTSILVRLPFVVTAAVVVTACGGSKDPPQQPQQQAYYPQQGQYPQQQPGQAGQYPQQQPGAYPQQQPGVPGAVPQGPAPTPAAQTSPTAPPGATDAATAAAVRLALQPRAANEAKGMKEDGDAIGGMVQEGGELTREFTLMPGKCYTILGQGLPPIAELDIQLVAKIPIPGLPPGVLAADQTTGPSASIGAGKNCYKYPFPVGGPVLLTVKAAKGSGPVGAQVYSK